MDVLSLSAANKDARFLAQGNWVLGHQGMNNLIASEAILYREAKQNLPVLIGTADLITVNRASG